jgi:hypothetical protein
MFLKRLLPVLPLFPFYHLCSAQQKDIASVTNDTIINYSAYKRSLSFAGLVQTRYIASLSSHVDVDGKHQPDSIRALNNTFLVKRAQLQVKAQVNDHFSAALMMNFAEFNTNPANKVLENAFIKYSLNRHFNLQAGQFRPFIGIEDALPVDIIRTLDYSNQYYAFGANGWQSFQIGLSVFGEKWKLALGGEYKNGTTFTMFNSSTLNPKPSLSEFRMHGFYFFPILRYEPKRPRMRALELSSRYEYFDEQYKLNSNPRLSGVLTWDDVKKESGAWDTIVWFSSLVMMGTFLNSLGFVGWFGNLIGARMSHLSCQLAFPLIILVYSYCHYMFASATAQVAAMYPVFLAVGVSVGVPGTMLAIFLGACATLMGALTHYGHGPAPIFFGSTYVDMKDWWVHGFRISVLFLAIWFIIGGLWWKVLGLW